MPEINRERRNAYSGSKYLEHSIRYSPEYKIFEDRNRMSTDALNTAKGEGGIIVLGEDVKTGAISTAEIDSYANEHGFTGWSVGNYLGGRYTAENGTVFSENSVSVELMGASSAALNEFAEKLCADFNLKAVLLKDYGNGTACVINGK